MAEAERKDIPESTMPARRGNEARGVARLAAVQALYQMEIAQTDAEKVLAEFAEHRFGHSLDGADYDEADEPFFRDLVLGVLSRQRDIDPLINQSLADGWRLARLDSTLRANLRAGTFELVARLDVPAKVIINEYVEVARAFFEGDEPKVTNAVLDRLARQLRPSEFLRP